MKLSYPKGNKVRFDLDLSKADNINNIPFTIEPTSMVGTNDSQYPFGLLCRFRVYAVNKNNDEVFGYLRDHQCSVIEFATKEIDLPVLIKFCSDTFINVEIDFQEKIRLPYNIFGSIRPQFDKMGESLLEQLTSLGCY
jgi:hypothetical protein